MEDEGRKAPNEDLDDNSNPASADNITGIIAQLKGKRPCVGNPSSAAGKKAPNEDLDDNSNPASADNITGKLIQLKGKRFFVRDSSSGAGTKALNGDHDDNPNHAIAGKIVQLEGMRFFVRNPRSSVDITGMKRLPYTGRSRLVVRKGGGISLEPCRERRYRTTPGTRIHSELKLGISRGRPVLDFKDDPTYQKLVAAGADVKVGGRGYVAWMPKENELDFKDDPTYQKLVAAGADVKVAGRGYVAWMPKENLK